MSIDRICCQNCGKGDAIHTCSLCKNTFYCNEECGAEDWVDHHKECNVKVSDTPIDAVMVPDEEFALVGDYVIQFPKDDGDGLSSIKLSDIARNYKSGEHYFFFPSKEGVPLGGEKVSNKMSLDYRLIITFQEISENGISGSTTITGEMRDVVVEKKSQSRAATEVVLQFRFSEEASSEFDKNITISNSAPTKLTFTLYKTHKDGNDNAEALVFSTVATVFPSTLFAKKNRVKGLRQIQRFGSDFKRNRQRSFFRSLATARLPSKSLYKGKAASLKSGVKIGIEVQYSQGQAEGYLKDVWFKIPRKIWREQELLPVVPPRDASIGSSLITTSPLKKMKIDTYNLQDITALCLHLRSSLADITDMMSENQEKDNTHFAMTKYASKISSCLKIMDVHHSMLLNEDGKGEEYVASPKVNSAIGQALKIQPVDAFFKSARVKYHEKKFKAQRTNFLLNNGRQLMERLQTKRGKLSTGVNIILMKRGKAKIRLQAIVNVLTKRFRENENKDVDDFLEEAGTVLAKERS